MPESSEMPGPGAAVMDQQNRWGSESGLRVSLEDFRRFVGDFAEYFLFRDTWSLPNPQDRESFNWMAFYGTGLWFSYLKMYGPAAGVIAFWIVVGALEILVFEVVLGGAETPRSLDHLEFLAVSWFCGTHANRWYLVHARRKIVDIRSVGRDEDWTRARISRKGGTSVMAVLGFIIALMMAWSLMLVGFDLLFDFGWF